MIFKKEDIQEGKRKGKGSNKNPEPCGIFGYATKGARGFERWQGGNWDRVKFWYWDECNSIEGGLNHDVFLRLNVFLSSMIRDKKNVKGLMTGNLLEKSNIFLERLGVGSRTRLKIFKVHKDNDPRKEVLSTMLYINTGDLFKGIESQSGLASQFLTEKEMTSLLSNRPGELAGKAIYEEVDLKNLKPLFAFVFTAPGSPTLANLDPEELIYIMYSYRVPESSRMVV